MNHVDRFHTALTVLAGHGHIKQRLIKAYEGNLVAINEDELPILLRQSFADLRCQMHSVMPLNGEGPICASVRKMSFDEASECAASVVSMYGAISRIEDYGPTTGATKEPASEQNLAERLFWAQSQLGI